MRPRDWFGVGVRLLGLYVVYDGFSYLVGFLARRMVDSRIARELGGGSVPGYYLVYAVCFLAFGFLLLWGAERLTRWAFNEPDTTAPEQNETISQSVH
jgi:hypothetical protein